MDTKLKKFNDHFAVRACAFILCIALVMISGTTVFLGVMKTDGAKHDAFGIDISDLSGSDSYFESDSFSAWATSAMHSMSTLMKYGNRENIQSGKFVNTDNGDAAESNLEMLLEEKYETILGESSSISDTKNSKYFETYGEDPEHVDYSYEVKPFEEMRDEFIKDYPDAVNEVKDSIISYQLGEYDEAKAYLDSIEGAGYSITKGETIITDPLEPESVGLTITYSNGVVTSDPDDIDFDENERYSNFPFYDLDTEENKGTVFTLSLSNDLVFEISDDFSAAKAVYNQYSIIAVSTFIGALLLFIYLMIVTGRRDETGKVRLYRSDRLYTELQFIVIAGLCSLTVLPVMMDVSVLGDLSINTWMSDTYNIAFLMLGIALEAILASGILWFILSIVRMLKAHIFISRSLIVIAVKAIYTWIKGLFSRANPMGKFVIVIVAACLLSMIPYIGPIVAILVVGFGYRWVKRYSAVKKGVKEVINGNLEYKIPVDNKSNTEFDNLARQINTISQASNIAIQNELKNQRLKTDLISNVSHDLKTPLTSIITYTDLLKTEGLDSPNARSYLDVIDEKGQRLKNLTEDLFEAAKASSGSIPVRMEKVDVLALIRQGLVEKSEGLEQKGLEIIINAPNDNYYVNADGQLLWRVVDNLLSNVEKYALENSRVYIDLDKKQLNEQSTPIVLFEMKNMSKAPLNIEEDELMERFKRGDTARSTEGSGLGLAIAKDLMRLQNGWFELKIDGDLFKSTVMLDVYDEATVNAAAAAAKQEAEIEEKMMHQSDPAMPRINND